jgi:very-short-patch-repair endonuclease
MSLNKKYELANLAKTISRDIRKKSTNAEKIFWESVRDKKLLDRKFYRQHPIFYDLTGIESFFIADFFCYEESLVVELDGQIHQYRLKKDSERTEILNALGLRVVRFKNEQIENNLIQVLEEVKTYFIK